MTRDTLAEHVRAELTSIPLERRCDRLAELSALFHTAGAAHLKGRGRLDFHLDLRSNAIARRAYALLRSLRLPSEIRTYRRPAFDAATRYQLHVSGSDDVLAAFVDVGVIARDRLLPDRPPGHVVARACCRGAYLRGAFLGGGSLSGPRSLHLEIRTPSRAGAGFVRAVAHAEGVRLRVHERADHALAYAKSREAVEGLLASMGARESVLELEEQAVVAELRGHANRLVNADQANLVRQGRAARLQVAAARGLRDDDRLARLPVPVQEAARLRLRHPGLSLRELAERADPPVSKAAMQRRLSVVVELARRSGL